MTAHSFSAGGRHNWAETTAARPCPGVRQGRLVSHPAGRRHRRLPPPGARRLQNEGRQERRRPISTRSASPSIPDAPMKPAGPVTPRADADALNAVSIRLAGTAHTEQGPSGRPAQAWAAGRGHRPQRLSVLARPRPREIARKLRDRFGQALLRVPGFIVKEGDGGPYLTLAGAAGLLIPVRDAAGRVVGIKVRRDGAGDAHGKYTWISSAKHGGPGPSALPHVPLGITPSDGLVRLTEGPLKSDIAAALSGILTVAAPGVANWRSCLAVLRHAGARTVRSVSTPIAATTRPWPALLTAAEALSAEGFALELERWDGGRQGH